MEYRCDILIPEDGGKVGKAVISSLVSHGLRCEQMDDRDVLFDDHLFLKNLLSKVEECRPRMIMPLFRSEVIASNRRKFNSDILLPVDDAANIHALDDKWTTSRICEELGFQQPRQYSDDQIDQISRYPVVFKRTSGFGGCGVYLPQSREALDKLLRTSSKKRPHLVMDYIDGYDISVDAIRWDGYFHAESYKVILPRQKGISFLRKSIKAPYIEEVLRTILEKADYKGVCGADFRVDSKTGEIHFLECNPRFSGGVSSQICSGFDMPYILWQLATGETPDPVTFKKNRYTCEMEEVLPWLGKCIRKGKIF